MSSLSLDASYGGRTRWRGFGRADVVLFITLAVGFVGLAGPIIVHARSMSGARQCSNNLRQIGRATALYMADHDGFFPFAYGETGADNWFGAISPYLSSIGNGPEKGKERLA